MGQFPLVLCNVLRQADDTSIRHSLASVQLDLTILLPLPMEVSLTGELLCNSCGQADDTVVRHSPANIKLDSTMLLPLPMEISLTGELLRDVFGQVDNTVVRHGVASVELDLAILLPLPMAASLTGKPAWRRDATTGAEAAELLDEPPWATGQSQIAFKFNFLPLLSSTPESLAHHTQLS